MAKRNKSGLRPRTENRLERMAARHGWNVKKSTKRKLLNRMDKALDSKYQKDAIMAAKVILEVDKFSHQIEMDQKALQLMEQDKELTIKFAETESVIDARNNIQKALPAPTEDSQHTEEESASDSCET